MSWKCPHCATPFAEYADGHECSAYTEYKVGGEIPNGAPGKDHDLAVTRPIAVGEAIRHAFHLVLMASGVRDGYESAIDPRSLYTAIRVYRPKDKFAHVGKPCNITDLDEVIHAGRAAQRLLNQFAVSSRLALPGSWRSHDAARLRVNALYSALRQAAAAHGVDPYTGQAISR
jgi:hypothetical protein